MKTIKFHENSYSQLRLQLLPPLHLCLYLPFPLQIIFHHADKAAIPPKQQQTLCVTCMSIQKKTGTGNFTDQTLTVFNSIFHMSVLVITIPVLHNLIQNFTSTNTTISIKITSDTAFKVIMDAMTKRPLTHMVT